MATEEKRRRDVVGGEHVAFPKPSSESSSVVATSPASARKVIMKSADMKESMQKEAIDCAIAAFEKHGVEKDIAEQIKKDFDKNYGPTWHCIVGRNFDEENVMIEMLATVLSSRRVDSFDFAGEHQICCSYVTHETNHFIYFYLDQKAILLFKSG